MSVNEAWKGRRFKTDKYKTYEKAVLLMLSQKQPPPPPFQIHFNLGVSNMAFDIDNAIKPFMDILQKKYGFNDRDIMKLTINKTITDKGSEFIGFELSSLNL